MKTSRFIAAAAVLTLVVGLTGCLTIILDDSNQRNYQEENQTNTESPVNSAQSESGESQQQPVHAPEKTEQGFYKDSPAEQNTGSDEKDNSGEAVNQIEPVEDLMIEENLYLPSLMKLAPDNRFTITAGVGAVGRDWTINLHLSATDTEDARYVSFPPSTDIRRTAVLSTEGYRRGQTVAYHFEVLIPGRGVPYVIGQKGGEPALGFRIAEGGIPEPQHHIFKFEDPKDFISKFLDLPQLINPVSGQENSIEVAIKDREALKWTVSFLFGDAGTQNMERVQLYRNGNIFHGTFIPKQNPGEKLEYIYNVNIPGYLGGNYFIGPEGFVPVAGKSKPQYTAAQLLDMMEIPPIRDYPDTSYEPSNPQYDDWSGARPIIRMIPEIKRWNFQVYFRLAGSGEDWSPAYSERVEIEKNVYGSHDNVDRRRNGSSAYYNIALPNSVYWEGDVIEYYLNIYLQDTGEAFDLFKDAPLRFKPSDQKRPETAENVNELFIDRNHLSGSQVRAGDTLWMGVYPMYEAHWSREYQIELYYRNGTGGFQKRVCQRSSNGNKYEYRLETSGSEPGTVLEYFYKIRMHDGTLMSLGTERDPFRMELVEEYSVDANY